MTTSKAAQRYTFYAWIDAAGVICESGFCPTDALGDYPRWRRPNGWRYVEHDLHELVEERTHFLDADGTIKRRERLAADEQAVPYFEPPPPQPQPQPRRTARGYH